MREMPMKSNDVSNMPSVGDTRKATLSRKWNNNGLFQKKSSDATEA